jgi:DNA-binding NtrC family response regulator
MSERAMVRPSAAHRVWIVEDEPAAAALASEMCVACGAEPSVFRAALPFLAALRSGTAPDAVILDWRLEHELSAALFLATRHRWPELPVIYWTGTPRDALPSMILDDRHAVVVDKAAGSHAFEQAVTRALGPPSTG